MVECVGQCTVWNTFCKWYWVSLGSHLMPSSKLQTEGFFFKLKLFHSHTQTMQLILITIFILHPCTKYTIESVVKLIELHPTAILDKAITGKYPVSHSGNG